MSQQVQIQHILEQLAGQRAPFGGAIAEKAIPSLETSGAEIGYSQLNELLLLFGFDRVTHAFFRFLLDGTTDYELGDAMSVDQLREGVRRFRKIAILLMAT